MPVNEFVTSANAIESLYITRQEVIDAISTIVPALSSFSTISFGVTPNPKFSTITMPSGGIIQGFAPIQTSNVVFSSGAGAGYAQKLVLGSVQPNNANAITVADVNNSNAPFQAGSLVARNGSNNGISGVYQSILPQSNVFTSANGVSQLPYIAWNGQTGATNAIALLNISSINGSPPNVNPTTYTTLTGTTINNSGVLTSPSVVGVSSLNALPISAYTNSNSQPWVSYAVTNTASYPFSLTSGTQTTVLSFSNVPIPTTSGREVTISVPVNIQLNPVPAGDVTLQVEAFIGGSLTLGTQVTNMIYVGANSLANLRTTLCGVATTNGTQQVLNIVITASQNVNVIVTQGAGTSPRQFFFQTLGF